jgi:uncharacterized protein YutE (UPF0331/DUF86 family)
MTLNCDLVRARCVEIEESVSRLERFRDLSREQFLADQDTLDLACYRLLVVLEAALALCYHVSARRLRKVSEEYAECFRMLQEAGILPAELAGRLQQMARFRNLLVRMYWKHVLEDRLRPRLRRGSAEFARPTGVFRGSGAAALSST